MAYTVPTLEELTRQAQELHRAELPGTDAFLWPNTEYVFMKAVAGMVHMNFRYLKWIKDQRFATLADGDELDNHGRPFGIARNPATAAHGLVEVIGTPGTSVPPGAIMQRSDGVQYWLTEGAVIQQTGNVLAAAEAVEVGVGGNAAPNGELTLLEAIAGITSIAIGADGIGGGSDLEGDEAFRARILFRMRNPPRGGAAHDYVFWALSIPGVTRVWVDPIAFGPGTVGVWIMTDGAGSYGIPNGQALSDVADYIADRKPSTARPIIQAPEAAVIDVSIGGMLYPSETVQDRIAAELADVFRRRVQVSVPSAPYTLRTNLLWQAVARITGSSEHFIALPKLDVAIPVGSIPVLGSICYV